MGIDIPDSLRTIDAERQWESHELETKLYARLDYLDEDGRRLVHAAATLAYTLHADQSERFDGTSVLSHVFGVANNALDVAPNADAVTVAAALLHDSVEDRTKRLRAFGAQIIPEEAQKDKKKEQALHMIETHLDKHHEGGMGKQVSDVVRDLSVPLTFFHTIRTKTPDGQRDYDRLKQKSDAYRAYVHDILNPSEMTEHAKQLILIKWSDSRENMPLGALKKKRDEFKGKNPREFDRLDWKIIKLQDRYGQAIRKEWLPFWERTSEEPFASHKEEATTFLNDLLKTDYAETSQ